MALPVGRRVHVVSAHQVRGEAVESLSALVAQNTSVIAVNDSEESVTRGISGESFPRDG